MRPRRSMGDGSLSRVMTKHFYKNWRITLVPFQMDNNQWICHYVLECKSKSGEVSTHRNQPVGMWDTEYYVEAGAVEHATAWIDSP